MTTFAELETLVVAQTRRPEIPNITKAAIKSAVLRAHHVDFFPRDLQSAQITYTPTGTAMYYDIANLTTQISRLRAPKFIYCLDAVTFTPVEKLEYRDSSDAYDADGNLRQSCYTLIGDTLRFWPQSATGRVEVWYYQNPVVSESGFASWIADTYDNEIAQWAAGIVWARTGFQEQARDAQDTHVKPFKELLLASHLLGTVN